MTALFCLIDYVQNNTHSQWQRQSVLDIKNQKQNKARLPEEKMCEKVHEGKNSSNAEGHCSY